MFVSSLEKLTSFILGYTSRASKAQRPIASLWRHFWACILENRNDIRTSLVQGDTEEGNDPKEIRRCYSEFLQTSNLSLKKLSRLYLHQTHFSNSKSLLYETF